MIRLIIKETHQPPIDTPASIRFKTHDITDLQLELKLVGSPYSNFQIVGSEHISDEKV